MQTYEHSGAVTPLGVLLTLAAGTISAVVLGFIYTYFVVWVPFIYVCFFGTVFFGMGIGLAVGWAGRTGKIRNNLVMALLGFGFGLFGLYVEWGVSPLALLGPQAGLSGFNPLVMLAFMQELYTKGSWGLFGNAPVTGIFLALFWVAEAIIIVGGSILMALGYSAAHPFCERCRQWTKKQEAVNAFSALLVGDEVMNRLKAGDLAALNEMPVLEQKVSRYVQVDSASCPTCNESHFLTMKLVLRTVDEKGKESLDNNDLVSNMVVTPADIEFARQAGKLLPE